MNTRIGTLLVITLFFFSNVYAEKVAIIGGGAAGLVTSWLLEQNYDVTLYEAADHLGGNVDSIEIKVNGNPVVVEAGVDFFNEAFYPHFLKLLRHFNIPLLPYTMVSTFYKTDGSDIFILPPIHDNKIEWKSFTPCNLYRALQLKMVVDNAHDIVYKHQTDLVLQEYIDGLALDKKFKSTFFYPFVSSFWGVSFNEVQDYLAYNTLKFFVEGNDVKNAQWYDIPSGLKTYVEAVHKDLKQSQVKLNARVKLIGKNNERYTILTEDGSYDEFDQIIFATEAEVASHLLSTLPETAELSAMLANLRYFDTKIAIHGDERYMPPKKEDWRVVNIRYDGKNSELSIYKPWRTMAPVFKSWITFDVRGGKQTDGPLPSNLYALTTFRHPAVDRNYLAVQKYIENRPLDKIRFVGMWTYDNDSHESAIVSAINLARQMAPNSERLKAID